MAQNLIQQLQSTDPRERAEAVKAMALSGDPAYLEHLKTVAESDPDPRLQDYARKAARHLYTSAQEKPPAQKPSRPAAEASRPPVETSRPAKTPTQEPPAPEPQVSRKDIEEADKKVQRAFSLHTSGHTKKALQVMTQALTINPGLEKQNFVRSLAADMTGKPTVEALRILKEPEGWKELVEPTRGRGGRTGSRTRPESSGLMPAPADAEPPTAGLIQTWLSYFAMDEDFLRGEASRSNHEDTLLSVFVITIASVAISMVTGSVQMQEITTLLGNELAQLGLNLGSIFFYLWNPLCLVPSN